MKIDFSSTVIMVDDLEKMKDFYTNVLKQEIGIDFGACVGYKCGFSLWKLNLDFPITKKLGTPYHKDGNKNMEVCFETDDFEEVVESLKPYDLKYLHNVTEEVWGQSTIRFYDPEGNLVEIGESVPCFVKRFHQQGLSLEEVAARTFVPIDVVKQIIG
ncbi:MAG: glyoxalase [Bacteroidetes bacterium 4572_77]|nr:MAG: glyoxalase [Bacteroidetes bacterium 4572_77]